ncbi:hypothetical protein [Actinomadura sp. NEAU-AAG7]|uniref:hypothetical protein n=1 Tax=Actinomadura sp. NEAU-AAG7 TaxID=2839640 RepID=UPI0027DF86BC|nr:hypothetical protein [Actinomadura sp. NEAU-AAG7]
MAPGREHDVRRFETCGQAWIGALRHVWTAGVAGLDDSGPIIEGPPVLFEVASLSWEDPLLREHGDRVGLARRARERTRPGAQERDGPGLRGPGLCGPGLGGAGGVDGVDRLGWVVDLLRARPWTTSAWIPLALPGEPAEGLPCVTALSFRIRGYRLIMTGMFRSQDVYAGYLTYIPLRGVQLQVAEELGLPAGPLRVFVDVPHVRVADAERVAAVLTALPKPSAA